MRTQVGGWECEESGQHSEEPGESRGHPRNPLKVVGGGPCQQEAGAGEGRWQAQVRSDRG